MTITYIGKSGLLNESLRPLLKNYITNNISAREYKFESSHRFDTIVWGGRYILGDILHTDLKDSNHKILYISTFIYNRFCDNYQIRKLNDSLMVQNLNGCTLDIPFICEFHNEIFKNIEMSTHSNYYTYRSKLVNISNAIINFNETGIVSLEKIRINLRLSQREKFLWNLFSILYLKRKSKFTKLNLYYSNFVKLIEKALHKFLLCHGISAVYIKKCIH